MPRFDALIDTRPFDDYPAGAAQAAALCEEAGYGGFWSSEHYHDPFLALTHAAAATSTVDLGSCIAIALARSPMTLAYTANDLQRQSHGRLVLGLGPQHSSHIARRYSMPADRPARRMGEFVAALRAIWACWNHGTPLDFQGDFYTHTLMNPYLAPPANPFGAPRIFLAAVGPRMTELAGRIADGVIAPPFATRRYLEEVFLPAVHRGLAAADRPRSALTVMCCPHVVTGRTPDELAQTAALARAEIALHCSPLDNSVVYDLHGLTGLRDKVNELALAGDPSTWDRMGDLVDDTVLNTFAIVAKPGDVATALTRRFGDLVDRIALPAPHSTPTGLWSATRLGLDQTDPAMRPLP
ncbi:TIGR03617 family F420-dependent LLM class oxidoreductase [Streptomyces albicerus]|uniref:TIGR03617 family F420-dependent LLM class oxidoreductase n=1 Tax=Streptomyces albicerus TaxID=2569859 RepID=UPI00124B33CE|nr:TIGR03617 family F420-dependent LLM class oxidoreductase [Streptomyces albicerus]